MNHYGKLAMKHWMKYAPDAVDCLIDPMEFFEDLGSQVEGMIVELAQEFEGMAKPAPQAWTLKTRIDTAERSSGSV